jgi:exosortase
MATASETKAEVAQPVAGDTWNRYGKVLLPYVIAIGAQLPLLIYYFSRLWGRPHYQFFPFALIMVAVFAAIRWPRHLEQPFFSSKLSNFLFWLGIVLGIAATLFSESWFAAASMVSLMTSLFARTKDGEVSGHSLIVLGLPLLIVLMPPNNLDFQIITTLQQVSARISSWFLDLLNFKHYSPGTTLNFPEHQYEVERACSGVQSFFTLMFCTSFMIISFRRPFFRSVVLLISAAFWAVFMNSVRILTIPVADILFNVKLIEGLPHDLLGYAAMLVAVLLILSTDQLLEYFFGRSSERVDDEQQVSWFRGRILGQRTTSESRKKKDARPVSTFTRRMALAGSLVVLALGALQFYDYARSLSQQRTRVRAFSTNVIVDVDREAMPDTIASSIPDESSGESRELVWQQAEYDRTDRTRGSDFGQRSDTWTFRSNSGLMVRASLDQTFPGWHELTTCYRNLGWEINPGARVKKSVEFTDENGEVTEWSYIECEMKDPTTGQTGFLLFSFSDANGTPFDAPIEWGNLRSFYERAKNRLFHSLRATLFRGEAYQMQVFALSQGRFQPELKEEIRSQYFQVRQAMRRALRKYGDNANFYDAASQAGAAQP